MTAQYAHEIVPHPEEGEAVELAVLVRYHYAQALAWHLAFADAIATDLTAIDFPLSQYLRHAHLAFLHDALSQELGGQQAADWASVRTHSESAELVWERAVKNGLDPEHVKPYRWRRATPST